jgi:hypothetical protein
MLFNPHCEFYLYTMNLKRPNKALEENIKKAVKDMLCPVHRKAATVSMPSENDEVLVDTCCKFFKKDVMIVAERMRKDFLYRAEKTRERLERERRKGERDNDD